MSFRGKPDVFDKKLLNISDAAHISLTSGVEETTPDKRKKKVLGRPDSHPYMFFTKPVLKRLKELDVTFDRSVGLWGLTLLTKNKAFQLFTFLEFHERNNAAGKYAITRFPPKLSLR
ncbi:hypothetical protein TNIN_499621 [Trichonephila inaurata madagascariensis]|uniref:Uncharacterized protein n=1 Tax=Trichonephila inaurata madagascariensis TaxID=2747483 RepID=A0A8X6IMP8_9ARAC|nr:hypothetical protein TNIN_499621 [Trichonephila inaurata madagascariensis]